MAILIDVPMPTGCKDCPMMMEYTSTGETVCIASQELLAYPHQTIQFEGRPDWCPLREVVRCKDCKRYESDGGALMICTLNDMIADDDCFCWWGERKEE